MSGTSADGVDAALVEIDAGKVRFRAATTRTFKEPLQTRLLSLNDTGPVTLTELVRLDLDIATAAAGADLFHQIGIVAATTA